MIPPCKNQIPLEIVRGTTNAFSLAIKDENDAPYTLEVGQVLVFGLMQNEEDTDRILIKRITNTVNGEYYLELSASDTENLPCGRYYYDIGLQHGDNVFYNVIEASPFIIKHNVTKLGDGA